MITKKGENIDGPKEPFNENKTVHLKGEEKFNEEKNQKF